MADLGAERLEAERLEAEREKENIERNYYKPIAVLPPIRQLSMHDWPFYLAGRSSKENIDNSMSAPALNRQARYEEEENKAAFWIEKMTAITLPPDSPNVQTLLHRWNQADAECLKARIFEKQHGMAAAEAYIVEHREVKTVQHLDKNGSALEVVDEMRSPRWVEDAYRCYLVWCLFQDPNESAVHAHIREQHPWSIPKIEERPKTVPISLYTKFDEMDKQRQAAVCEASKLPDPHNKYFQCRVKQAGIVREYEYELAMGIQTFDVTELKNALEPGEIETEEEGMEPAPDDEGPTVCQEPENG